nr:ATP synthase F1 subunit delta [Orientia tsutsugamushi]
MHKLNNVAVLYAKILFKQAIKLNIVSKVKQDLKALKQFCKFLAKQNMSLQFIALMKNKINLMDYLSSTYELDHLTYNFLKLLQKNNRLTYLSHIIIAFDAQVRNYQGVTLGYLITTIKWSKAAIKDIKAIFERKLNRKLIISNIVDKSIVGGIILRYDDYEYDLSMLGAINRFKSRIKLNY